MGNPIDPLVIPKSTGSNVAPHRCAPSCCTIRPKVRQATDHITQYYPVRDRNYWEVFPRIVENPQRGCPAKDYRLSVAAAKELSMVERKKAQPRARKQT